MIHEQRRGNRHSHLLVCCLLALILLPPPASSQCSVDSLSMRATPFWLVSRIALSECKVVATIVDGQEVRTVRVSEKTSIDFLTERDGQIDFGEAFPDGENPYQMPVLLLFASMASPLNIRESGLEPFFDGAIRRFLGETGKLKDDELRSDIRFYPGGVKKTMNGFLVVSWVPAAVFAGLGANEELTQ